MGSPLALTPLTEPTQYANPQAPPPGFNVAMAYLLGQCRVVSYERELLCRWLDNQPSLN